MKFSIKDFFSKCNQIYRKLQILSHLLKKSLMENFIFCVVLRVFDETFEFLANLEPADDSAVISDSEIILPEIPAYDINKDFSNY